MAARQCLLEAMARRMNFLMWLRSNGSRGTDVFLNLVFIPRTINAILLSPYGESFPTSAQCHAIDAETVSITATDFLGAITVTKYLSNAAGLGGTSLNLCARAKESQRIHSRLYARIVPGATLSAMNSSATAFTCLSSNIFT